MVKDERRGQEHHDHGTRKHRMDYPAHDAVQEDHAEDTESGAPQTDNRALIAGHASPTFLDCPRADWLPVPSN